MVTENSKYSIVVTKSNGENDTKVYTLDTKEKAELYLIRLVSLYCKENALNILDVHFDGHKYENENKKISWEIIESPCVGNILA